MKNNTLIILGMHRSGTSLVAHWLQLCGLHLGDNLVGPSIGNEEGHFEDIDFLDLNMQILRRHSMPDTGFGETLVNSLSFYEQEKMKALISLKNNLHEQWGWKEPRTVVLLKFYRQLLPAAKYIIVFRDFNSVVNSLVQREYEIFENRYTDKRKKLGELILRLYLKKRMYAFLYSKHTERYLKAWVTFNNEILSHIQNADRNDFIVINYQSLLDYSKEIFSCLTNQWQFSLNYTDFRSMFKEYMIHKDVKNIKKYVKNKLLLEQAEKMLEELNFSLLKQVPEKMKI